MRKAFAAVWLAIFATTTCGQTVDTNRPGFSFTPGTVPAGRWQLETGIAHDRPNSRDEATTLPLAELRYGLAAGREVFLSGLSWTRSDSDGASADGLADVLLGAKIALPTRASAGSTSADTAWKASLLLTLSVPVGSSEFSSDSWDPGAGLVWTRNGVLPLAGTARVSYVDDQWRFDNGLKLPLSLGGPHSVFLEWEANIPENGDDSHWLNGGYQYLLGERLQLDFNAGAGLNDAAGDWRLGIGFSRLF
ncbi:MAG: transporter [Halieaceae bacterium]|jgi:hypothetical protein|nr:transporter [Halieaceae bacterium]